MSLYNLKRSINAVIIESIDNCCITTTDGNEIHVSHEWIALNEPKSGDYYFDDQCMRPLLFKSIYGEIKEVVVETNCEVTADPVVETDEEMVERIARVAHELNRAYCESIGDDTQVPWDIAEQWQKDSAMNGVLFHIVNPDADASASHDNWLAAKLADGWLHGEEKDADKKTHPCIMPFDDLPADQKSKDFLFRGVVHALAIAN